jgi:folate-binding protein YgfZ
MAEPTPLHDAAAQAGAVFTEDTGWLVPDHFGEPAREYDQARSGCVLFDQSHRGKVELTGADAGNFLHNLCTNDVKNLAAGAGCEAFLTTAKAKVVAYLFLYHRRQPDGRPSFWLDLAPGTSEAVLKHLDHFLISEQVEFADRTRELAQMHVTGPQAEAVLARTQLGDQAQVRRHDLLGVAGFDVLCPAAEAESVWKSLLGNGAVPAGRQTFEVLRVEAGTPVQGLDIDENTFAPEVGRTAQAICYTKGCFLGQEPIVMARDRGQVNRTLLGLKLSGGTVPHGSLLFRDGKEVGRVTSHVVSPRLGTAIALAYVRRGSQEPGTVVEVEVGGQRLSAVVTRLPFSA